MPTPGPSYPTWTDPRQQPRSRGVRSEDTHRHDEGSQLRRQHGSCAKDSVSGRGAPDGICADPQGGVWVSAALGNAVVRYAEGGAVTGMVETSQIAYACALGGDDGRTLFVMTAPSSDPHEVDGQRLGRIEVATV